MKKFRLRMFIYLLLFVGIVGVLSFSCYGTWKKIKANEAEAVKLEQEYKELLENEDNLSNEVVKLQDPEYVAKYAREKYLYTKDGELVIDMTSLDD